MVSKGLTLFNYGNEFGSKLDKRTFNFLDLLLNLLGVKSLLCNIGISKSLFNWFLFLYGDMFVPS